MVAGGEKDVRDHASQETSIKNQHGTMDCFKTGKVIQQDCILSPCLFNFYADYIMGNASRDESQAGIKITRRNINSIRYADDTTLMAESEEELKSPRIWLKTQHSKS